MARYAGDELPLKIKTIDGEAHTYLDTDSEGIYYSLTNDQVEAAFKAAGIRYRGRYGKYWIHSHDWQAAHAAINRAAALEGQ